MGFGLFHIPQGFYPQNDGEQYRTTALGWETKFIARLSRWRMNSRREVGFVAAVLNWDCELQGLSQAELITQLRHLRYTARKTQLDEATLAKIFAVVREASRRTLGMQHFASQIAGAWAMMQGRVIEMDTGEGKSLCATLACAAAALLGVPVHLLTVNEYLAQRDAELFRALYEFLGLRVSWVGEALSEAEKKAAYACHVVYCTNKQVTFDYLRDRLTMKHQAGSLQMRLESLYASRDRTEDLILRGLHFAIVDEADSIFIDEAITPLIISAARDKNQRRAFYTKALLLANQLQEGRDFVLLRAHHLVQFTSKGSERIDTLGKKWGGLWAASCPRDELVTQALKAMHFFVLGQHYLVQEGKVVIVDEFTGRTMADRSWEAGLHQMIELKEGCEMTAERETLAKISYQRFFRRYVNIAGMTGTAEEVRSEIKQVYGLEVYRIRREHPLCRATQPVRYFAEQAQKWSAIVARIQELRQSGKACLVGTRTVATSQHLAALLHAAEVPHQLLNAENPAQEAAIVARAGRSGQVTIATNMAGRGTDIKIDAAVRQSGGLHVLATEKHESGRIDRQLYGRCARQGDPGWVEIFLAADDDLLRQEMPAWLLRALAASFTFSRWLAEWATALAFAYSQNAVEKRHYKMRRSVLKSDTQQAKMMAFSGGTE